MLTKICSACKQIKPLDEFVKNKSKKDGHGSSCKVCKRVYDNNYYKNNPVYAKQVRLWSERKIKENKSFIKNYLLEHPCVDCGNNDIDVLEFDHRHNKTMGIANMVYDGFSVESIKLEITKCDVRCANCHKKRHAIERRRSHSSIG